jgi:hypothetical protein
MSTADRPYKEKKNGVNPYIEINEHTALSSQQYVSLCNEWLKLYWFYYIINIIVIINSIAAIVVAVAEVAVVVVVVVVVVVAAAAEMKVILVIIGVTGRKPIKITL